ncbi:hypothetical protein ACFWIS_15365, partial [Kitasatospora sp. NPDC127060]
MSTGELVAIIVPIAVVVVLVVAALWFVDRRRRLRERFGPEYERPPTPPARGPVGQPDRDPSPR